MSQDFNLTEYKRRMDGAITSLKQEFSGLRTGRAAASLLDNIDVEAYGAMTPISQLGTVQVPEPRMLSVQVWDKNLIGAVEKGIRNSKLGVNPVVDGQTVRIPIPPLNEERRQDLAKVASGYAEQARVAIRNVRRDAMDTLKRLEKDGIIGEDEHKAHAEDVQTATNESIKAVDDSLKAKQDEIMQV